MEECGKKGYVPRVERLMVVVMVVVVCPVRQLSDGVTYPGTAQSWRAFSLQQGSANGLKGLDALFSSTEFKAHE